MWSVVSVSLLADVPEGVVNANGENWRQHRALELTGIGSWGCARVVNRQIEDTERNIGLKKIRVGPHKEYARSVPNRN